MSTSYVRLPLGGSVPSYASLAAFPSAVSAGNGTLAIALDTDILYISTGSVWEAIGGGSVPLSIGTIDSQTPSSDGAVLASNTLVMQSASSTKPGLINLTTQSFAGNKTFVGSVVASNLSGTNTGDVTLGTASGLTLTGQALSLALSSTSTTGALSSTDWNTFNGKQASGNYITALTGDGAASGPGSAALTLATVNANVGSFGDSTHVGGFTVNGKGLVTAASSTLIQIAESQVTNLVSDLAGKQPVGNYITALTGDISASGPGSVASTLATVNSNVGSFTYSAITVNAKGLVTAASSGAAPVTTLAAVGSSPNANGASISSNTLNLQPFDGTHPGVVTASGGGSTNFLRADGSWAAPGGGGGSSLNYAQAFTTSAASWSTSSATYADPTVSGTPAITVRTSSGITLTQAGSNFPGITFTPANNTDVFLITAQVTIQYSAGTISLRLYDGTSVIVQGGGTSDLGTGGFATVSMTGVYAPATTSAVTVRVQMTSSSGTGSIISTGGGLTNPVEWTVLKIG